MEEQQTEDSEEVKKISLKQALLKIFLFFCFWVFIIPYWIYKTKWSNWLKAALIFPFFLFIGIAVIAAAVPTAPTLALDETKPTRFSNTDIKGKTSINKPLYLQQNNQLISETTSTSDGSFAFHIEDLKEGSHTYTVEACRNKEKKQCKSELVTVIVDQTPPQIPTITQYPELTEDEKQKVAGVSEANTTIKLSNTDKEIETKADGEGNFQAEIPLKIGRNTITAIAIDEAQNQSQQTQITINRKEVLGTQQEQVKVVRVIDGDTIEIEDGKRVRYIGINTPETVDPNSPVECYGKEASNKNKELVGGKTVGLEKDVSKTDKYGRLLRYIWVDGTMINEYLVRNGYAQSSTYPPDVKYQDRFREAERLARNEGLGLWSSFCDNWNKPTPTPKPVQSTSTYIAPTQAPTTAPVVLPVSGGGGYSCDCSKTCPEISSCQEAQYLLNTCGCSARDADKDDIACDSAPLHCQN